MNTNTKLSKTKMQSLENQMISFFINTKSFPKIFFI